MQTGYKATDNNMQCMGFQFEIGVWYEHKGELKMCESGFHFCEYPSGPWSYYHEKGTRIFKVEADGVVPNEEPGADKKYVCRKIRLTEEIVISGDGNTGDMNTGHRNSGHWNSGDRNTGHRNSGGWNTGDGNTGYWNSGHRNSGDSNTGDRNTGHWNSGHWNTGDGNTGYWNTGHSNSGYGNVGNYHSGFFCKKEEPFFIFDLPANRKDMDVDLANELAYILSKDEPIEIDRFLSLPNATSWRIKALHEAHKKARSQGNKQ